MSRLPDPPRLPFLSLSPARPARPQWDSPRKGQIPSLGQVPARAAPGRTLWRPPQHAFLRDSLSLLGVLHAEVKPRCCSFPPGSSADFPRGSQVGTSAPTRGRGLTFNSLGISGPPGMFGQGPGAPWAGSPHSVLAPAGMGNHRAGLGPWLSPRSRALRHGRPCADTYCSSGICALFVLGDLRKGRFSKSPGLIVELNFNCTGSCHV